MKVGILNSGGFNINSIKFALNRLSVFDVEIVKLQSEFELCDRIIIPGVGHAKTAMEMIAFTLKAFFGAGDSVSIRSAIRIKVTLQNSDSSNLIYHCPTFF